MHTGFILTAKVLWDKVYEFDDPRRSNDCVNKVVGNFGNMNLKLTGLGNDTPKENIVMSPAKDEPVVAFGNNKGREEANVG
ncbi:hypothetical protein Tco_1536646 [Tanacetum coccineum]